MKTENPYACLTDPPRRVSFEDVFFENWRTGCDCDDQGAIENLLQVAFGSQGSDAAFVCSKNSTAAFVRNYTGLLVGFASISCAYHEVVMMNIKQLNQKLNALEEIGFDVWPPQLNEDLARERSALEVERNYLHSFHGKLIKPGSVYLSYLVVDANYRDKGIGSELLAMASEFALRECGKGTLFLHVLKSDNGVVEFYKKAGFKEWCAIANFYAVGEDGVVMKKKVRREDDLF